MCVERHHQDVKVFWLFKQGLWGQLYRRMWVWVKAKEWNRLDLPMVSSRRASLGLMPLGAAAHSSVLQCLPTAQRAALFCCRNRDLVKSSPCSVNVWRNPWVAPIATNQEKLLSWFGWDGILGQPWSAMLSQLGQLPWTGCRCTSYCKCHTWYKSISLLRVELLGVLLFLLFTPGGLVHHSLLRTACWWPLLLVSDHYCLLVTTVCSLGWV